MHGMARAVLLITIDRFSNYVTGSQLLFVRMDNAKHVVYLFEWFLFIVNLKNSDISDSRISS